MSDTADHVIVVGAGIIGMACAHYLSAAGFNVTLIDKGDPGQACSQSNCGYICPSHVLPLNSMGSLKKGMRSLLNPAAPFRLKLQWRAGLYRWLYEFARRCGEREMIAAGNQLQPLLASSRAAYQQLMSTDDFDCGWRESGLLYVFQSVEGFDDYAQEDQLLADHYGVSADRIPGDELPTLDPALRANLAGAFLYRDDAMLNPDQLVRQWPARLAERGVRLVSNCSLNHVRRERAHIVGIETTQGTMTADHYVFALGAWSTQMAENIGCPIPIEPGKGYSVTMTQPEQCPSYPMLFLEHGIGMTPLDDGYRLGSMMEFVGYDSSIPAHRIAQLGEAAAHYLNTPTGQESRATWFGWRPMTWDSLPIIGRVPGADNALLATGHNMLGLTLAPATGQLITEMIQEQPTHIDATAFAPSRF